MQRDQRNGIGCAAVLVLCQILLLCVVDTDNTRYKHTLGTEGGILIAN